MKDLAKIIRNLRERAEFTKTEFASKLGVSFGTVHGWEIGRKIPTIERVQQMTKILGLSVKDASELEQTAAIARVGTTNLNIILEGREEARRLFSRSDCLPPEAGPTIRHVQVLAQRQGKRYQQVNKQKADYDEATGLVAIRVLRDPAAAGPGRTITDADIEGWGIIHRDWCPNPEQTDYVRIQGSSMEPTLPDGALVTIDRAETNADKLSGSVVAIWRGETGEVTIKRLFKSKETGRYVASPDNRSAEHVPFEVDLNDGDRIIGRIRSVHAPVK